MGPGAGGGTHKTEKHVISPRRGEKARLREISRRLVLLLTPATIPPRHPSVVGVPFLTLPSFLLSRTKRASDMVLFICSNKRDCEISRCYLSGFSSFFMCRLSRGKYEDSCLTRINHCFSPHEKLGSLISEIIEK